MITIGIAGAVVGAIVGALVIASLGRKRESS
jgi:hypothetical protein